MNNIKEKILEIICLNKDIKKIKISLLNYSKIVAETDIYHLLDLITDLDLTQDGHYATFCGVAIYVNHDLDNKFQVFINNKWSCPILLTEIINLDKYLKLQSFY